MLIMTHWEGQDWWNNNKLETEILDDSNDRYRFFYRDAREAAGLPDKSLEVYYLCVRWGSAACIAIPNRMLPPRRGTCCTPPTLEQWWQQAYAGIRLAAPPAIDGQRETIEGVYPLEGPATLIWASFFGLILVVLAGIFGYLYFLSMQK